MEESFQKRPEHLVDKEINQFKENIKNRRIAWTQDEKIELETDKFDDDETLENTNVHFTDMNPVFINNDLKQLIKNDFKIIGFDESSNSFTGTYAKLASFKFGEGQLTFKNGKYKKELIMYKPIGAYIEDNQHKLIIYRDIIENFVNTIKEGFYKGVLKQKIDHLEEWFLTTYKKKIDDHIKANNYYYPSIGHVIDRIRTADEILKSLVRIRDISNWGNNKKVIFLGDGIQMFRQHIFPPQAFINFFYQFIQDYNIKYYSFSKTCRLRDAQGNFLLPIWSSIIEKEQFLVELPDLSKYTKSKPYIVRLQEGHAPLRFDIPDFLTSNEAKNILRNLIPYSPRGYPLCLEDAHKASTLLQSEYNKFEAEFLSLQYDKKTNKLIQKWRDKVLSS